MKVPDFNQTTKEKSNKNLLKIFVRCCCSAWFHGLIVGCLTAGLILAVLLAFWLTSSSIQVTYEMTTMISTSTASKQFIFAYSFDETQVFISFRFASIDEYE